MLLYVNGDSHTAAAEAVVRHAWACDDGDPVVQQLGRRPHPDNDRVSYGYRLSNDLNWSYLNDSQAGASNYRILRTTRDFVSSRPDLWPELFVLVQWSTWEREEWCINDAYYQVNASGIDAVPESHQQVYKQWIVDVDWREKTRYWHNEIHRLHCDLASKRIAHLFFNGDMAFESGWVSLNERHDWQQCYIDPYSESGTYQKILKNHGFRCQLPYNYHFGKDAHCFWSQYLLQYITDNNLVKLHALCTD